MSKTASLVAALLLCSTAAKAGMDATPDMSGYMRLDQMPAPALAMPPATALDSSPGTSSSYARADHTHASRIQSTVVTTGIDGTATWNFAKPIAVPTGSTKLPPVANTVQDAGSPVVVQIISRIVTTDGTTDMHRGIVIKAMRSRPLPSLLSSLNAMANYDVFANAAASVSVSLWVSEPTQ